MFCHYSTSDQCPEGFKPLERLSCGSYVSGVQGGDVGEGLSRAGGKKVPASQGSCGVTTGQSRHPGKFGPFRIEDMVRMQVASMVEMSGVGQSRSERVVGIGGSLCCRAIVESLLATAVFGENRPTRAADSSSYRGSVGGGYIEGGLSGSPGRKGPCARV